MDANNILKIFRPADLFDLSDLKKSYRAVIKVWHPDKRPGATDAEEVFLHIQKLYQAAQDGIDSIDDKAVSLKSLDGKRFNLRFVSKFNTELGDVYVGDTFVLYTFAKDCKDFFENAVKRISSIKYPPGMDGLKNLVPVIKKSFETEDGYVLVLEKSASVLSVRDINAYFVNNSIEFEGKHVAWIITRLCNIEALMEYNNLVHNGMTVDNLFIDPKTHQVVLMGGWWYTVGIGKKMLGIHKDVLKFSPASILDEKKGDKRVDGECMKLVARTLLGDMYGHTLKVPDAKRLWLKAPANGGLDDLLEWEKVRDGLGPRKFVEFNVSKGLIYGGKNV